jgi:hypothetical protein
MRAARSVHGTSGRRILRDRWVRAAPVSDRGTLAVGNEQSSSTEDVDWATKERHGL